MSAIATIARVAARLLPLIKEAVDAVEISHGHYTGPAKKDLALRVVERLYNHTEPAVEYAQLAEQVASTIDVLVETYNNSGEFVKATAKEAA